MRNAIVLLSFIMTAVLSTVFACFVHAEQYYKWVDEGGNLHVSDTLDAVPQKYRNQVDRRRFDSDETRSEPVPSPAQSPVKPAAKIRNTKRSAAATEAEKNEPKRYEVPYKPFEGSARRVIITVLFNGSVNAPMAIDTGAPSTMISEALAEKLGLFDKDHGRLFVHARGLGGETLAVRSIIDTMQVGDAKSIFVPTTITESLSDAFDGLLGLDFVSNYSVTIDAKRKVVIFEELPVDPEHPGGHDKEWWSALFKEFASYRSGWKEYNESLKLKIRDSMISPKDDLIAWQRFAEYQYHEADKLFDKLNRYAREHSVPMHWKQY